MMGNPGWKFLLVQALTLMRIPLILVFLSVSIWVNGRPSPQWFSIAFGAMILSAVTDLFDGYLARRFKVTSRLGAYADPLADKFFYLTAFPTLIYLAALQEGSQHMHTRLLLALTIFFLMRDQWVSFLRSIGAIHGVSGKAHMVGKIRTFVSFPVICVIYYYLQAPAGWPPLIARWFTYSLEWALIVINLYSIYYYTAFYWPWLRKEMRPDTDTSSSDS